MEVAPPWLVGTVPLHPAGGISASLGGALRVEHGDQVFVSAFQRSPSAADTDMKTDKGTKGRFWKAAKTESNL